MVTMKDGSTAETVPYGFRSQWWEAYNSLLKYIILFVKETKNGKVPASCIFLIIE